VSQFAQTTVFRLYHTYIQTQLVTTLGIWSGSALDLMANDNYAID
jgi:hypothetical protein